MELRTHPCRDNLLAGQMHRLVVVAGMDPLLLDAGMSMASAGVGIG